MTEEQWLPASGFEESFEVSTTGRVRSVDRVLTDKNGQKRAWKGRIRSQFTGNPNGYAVINLTKKSGNVYVHRLVCETFHGKKPFTGAVVRHLDGDKTNNTPANLAWGTQSDNRFDDVANGTHHYSKRTHCRNGHEYTEENTVEGTFSGRICKACRNSNKEKWNQAKKEEGLAPGDPRHGTTTAFTSYRCKCETCVSAKRLYERELYRIRQAKKQGLVLD